MTSDIWEVIFAYETPGEKASNIDKRVYTIIADSEKGAYNKAYGCFSKTQTFLDLCLVDRGVQTTLKKITNQKVKLPKLTLEEDLKRYQVTPELSEDGQFIVYCVSERE